MNDHEIKKSTLQWFPTIEERDAYARGLNACLGFFRNKYYLASKEDNVSDGLYGAFLILDEEERRKANASYAAWVRGNGGM